MATIMSHNLPLIPLPLKATTAAALAKTTAGLMMSGLLGKHPGEDVYGNGTIGIPTDRSSPDVASSEARSSPESLMMVQQKEREDDRMSCCSDDSELSVGQEGLEEKTMNSDEKLSVISANSRMAAVDVEKLIERHNVEMGDEISNDSSRYSSSKDPSEDYMKIPLMRPSPTRLHEEFLRNSQLYAEELMRQQMQIVAAARGLNLSPKPLDAGLGLVARMQDNRSPGRASLTEEQKIGFRPHIRGIGEIYHDRHRWSDERSVQSPPESTSFRGIHSHLSAISQITQNLNSDISKLTSPASLASMTSRESSQSPPQHPGHLLQMNNNIALNDQNLKFSIDNILKADFGRRITDPLKRSGKNFAKKPSAPGEKPTAMDLTALVTNGGSASCSVASRSLSSSASGSELEVPTSPSSSSGKTAAETSSGSGSSSASGGSSSSSSGGPMVWPAWVYCTRYSDRPSSGRSPRARKPKKSPSEKAPAASNGTGGGGSSGASSGALADDKRPRTAFSGPQLARLKHEFAENRYLTERRRQQLSAELGLNEAQIKIWFQNKRAKIKKSSGQKNPLALQLMAQGLYNHSTIPLTREEEELQEMQAAAQAAAESRIGSSPASG